MTFIMLNLLTLEHSNLFYWLHWLYALFLLRDTILGTELVLWDIIASQFFPSPVFCIFWKKNSDMITKLAK